LASAGAGARAMITAADISLVCGSIAVLLLRFRDDGTNCRRRNQKIRSP
jgi:hypothetical protein